MKTAQETFSLLFFDLFSKYQIDFSYVFWLKYCPLILFPLDELHQQLLGTGAIDVLIEFTRSSNFEIKLDATKSLCVLSINGMEIPNSSKYYFITNNPLFLLENLREDLFVAAGSRLMELVESDNVQIQTFALTTLGNIAFKGLFFFPFSSSL